MTGVCDGLRVIDFSTGMAGPLASMVLADNGTDVIKVEPPQGDPVRSLPAFQTWNRGKKSVVLDLNTDAGRERGLDLGAEADAVIVSVEGGRAAKRLLTYEEVCETNASVIYAEISGYGDHPTLSGLPAYEPLVAAKAGRMMMFERIAERDGPVYPALPVASFSAAMLTVQGILAALHARRATGYGQKVSVSLLDALMPYDMVQWIAPQLRALDEQTAQRAAQKGAYNAPRTAEGNSDGGRYDPQQVHRPGFRVPRPNYLPAVTKDGVWLQFANTADHFWLAQMEAMGLVELYGDERFAKMPSVANEADSEALWELVLERARSKTYDEWAAIFDANENVAVDRFRTPLESIEHRQVAYNGHIVEVDGLDGQKTLQPGPLVRFSESTTSIGARAPTLGEHMQEVLTGREGGSETRPYTSSSDESTASDGEKRRGPLDGITILDFATFFAAPYATTLLANLGARVIKIEPPGGDYSRYSAGGLLAFPTTQGKQSIAVDLKRPEGKEIVRKLIERADLLLHNFRPGVPERLGIDYESCRTINPRLVYLYGASYGDSGPDAKRPAFHPIAGAISGNAMRQAGAGHPRPDSASLPIDELKREAWRMLRANEANPDVNAALAAATALMLGLHARETTGRGQYLQTTMIASNMYANSDELIAYEGRPPPRRPDEQLFGLAPAYRLYEAKEGWVFVACTNDGEWGAFVHSLKRDDLHDRWQDACESESESAAARELVSAIASQMGSHTASEWEELMLNHGAPCVAVEMRDMGRVFLEDEALRERGSVVQVESAVYGSYWRHGSPVRFSEHDLALGPVEPVGGHTRDVLSDLGYSDGQIGAFAETNVVEVWTP